MDLLRLLLRGMIQGAGILLGLGSAALLAVTVSGTVNSFSSGEVVSASAINQNFTSLKSAIEGLPDCTEHSVMLRMSGTTSVPTGTGVVPSWDTEVYDATNMHDPSAPTRITVPLAGRYQVRVQLNYSTNATGDRVVSISRNGTLEATNYARAPCCNFGATQTSVVLDMAAGDFITVETAQDSGSTLSLNAVPQRVSEFSAYRICGN